MEEDFNDYALKIWQNDSSVRADRMRWHQSRYHIKKRSLNIEDMIEDAMEVLDISPEECNIPISIEKWQEDFMNEPKMIVVMARLIYQNLKKFGCYAFDKEPDWDEVIRDYSGKMKN